MFAIRYPVGCYHREMNGLFFFLSSYYLIFDFLCKNTKKTIAAKYSILYSAAIMLFYTLSARYRR